MAFPDRLFSGGLVPMPTHPLALSRPRRLFTGYDRERASYERLKHELLATAEGRFVVFVGDQMLGPFATEDEAERSGYAEFGLGPLYIKRVSAEEPVAVLPRGMSR
jgi:hypothetical protein